MTALSLQLKGRVPVQAAEDIVQDADLPPERRREGTGVSAHRRGGELEAGHKDGSGQLRLKLRRLECNVGDFVFNLSI